MKQPPYAFQRSRAQIAIAALVLIYIAINVFRLGGDNFVINLNNNIANPLALGVTVLAFMLWKKLGLNSKNRLLWSGLTIGWALWTVAEFWWGIAALINQETPYPSGADFFWLAGYIPMYIALWERTRSLPPKIARWQKTATWLSALFSIGWTIWFVLFPAIQESDPAAVVESALAVVYPLADLFVLILVLQIFFTFRQGMYGHAWRWISAGFVIVSISDLMFMYTSAANLYYPNGEANLLSTIGVEVPYTLGYLFWLIGLSIVWAIQKSHQTLEETLEPLTLVPNVHLLIMAKEDNSVTSVSLNYWRVYQHEFIQGKKLADVIGCSPEYVTSFLNKIKSKKILTERAIPVQTRFGIQQALVSGIAAASTYERYRGIILLLRLYAEDYYLDELTTDYQRSMICSVMEKTGTQAKEDEDIKQLLAHYHLVYLNAFYNKVFTEGGSIMADAFITELESAMKNCDWQISIRPDNLLDVSAVSLSETREALPKLTETARQFVAQITDESIADSIIQRVQTSFDETILKNVLYFEKAKTLPS